MNDENRICSRCKLEKNLNEFRFKYKNKGIRQSHCRECQRLYVREHYLANTEYYINKAKNRKPKAKLTHAIFLLSIKKECADCGNTHPAVLEFHHLNPNIKENDIGRMTSRRKILEESKKCVVLCANCHRIRHWNNRRSHRKQSDDQLLLPIP